MAPSEVGCGGRSVDSITKNESVQYAAFTAEKRPKVAARAAALQRASVLCTHVFGVTCATLACICASVMFAFVPIEQALLLVALQNAGSQVFLFAQPEALCASSALLVEMLSPKKLLRTYVLRMRRRAGGVGGGGLGGGEEGGKAASMAELAVACT